jgi:hypothetical protein
MDARSWLSTATSNRYTGDWPSLPRDDQVALAAAAARLQMLAAGINLERPSAMRGAAAHAAVSLADWLARHVRTSGARQVLRVALLPAVAAEPAEVSLLTPCSILGPGAARRAWRTRYSAAAPASRGRIAGASGWGRWPSDSRRSWGMPCGLVDQCEPSSKTTR